MNRPPMSYTIHKVSTERDKRIFLDVAREIYRGDKNWICPLDKQIYNIFEPAKNSYYTHGNAERWIMKDKNGALAGRIAAFIDEDKKMNSGLAAGGIGFFECVDDIAAAILLFDTAKQWLMDHGAAAMDGPINFGENDRFWGLLTEGFTEPAFTTNYHHPYYRPLFEQYGFRPYYEMTTNVLDLEKPLPERFERIWEWVKQKEGVTIRHPRKNELEEYAAYFREIYNEAWLLHEEYKPVTMERARKFAKEIGFLFISAMLPFAFVGNEPAGFIVCTPDLNQVFKRFNGRMNKLQLLLFLWRSRNDFAWYRKRGILTKGHAIAIGVKPKYQQHGLETGMITSTLQDIRDMGFKSIELRWTGDFNPKIQRLHAAVGAQQKHKHITYRMIFDPTVEFKKYGYIPLGKERSANL